MESAVDGPEQTVYVLRAPGSRLVRYVGRTGIALDVRLHQHLYDALDRATFPSGQRPLGAWIRRLARAGQRPEITGVSTMAARYMPTIERRCIQQIYAGPHLLNVAHNYWWQRRRPLRARPQAPVRPRQARRPTGRLWRPRP